MGFLEARCEFLATLIGRYTQPGWNILEVGCRAGRNLATLFDAGFKELSGVEGDARRVAVLREDFPRLRDARIVNAQFLEAAAAFPDGEFDLVFTVGFFEGGPAGYSRFFDEMARLAGRCLVVIEDERQRDEGAGPFSYRNAFEPLGFSQAEELELAGLPELDSVFTARVFLKT